MGGSKPKVVKPPPPPPVIPMPDTEMTGAAKRKELARNTARTGRESTKLSDQGGGGKLGG